MLVVSSKKIDPVLGQEWYTKHSNGAKITITDLFFPLFPAKILPEALRGDRSLKQIQV